jgi:hypothetical protein
VVRQRAPPIPYQIRPRRDVRSIVRVEHDKDRPFLVVSKATVQDNSLTFEARGFLLYLLSKPDDWQIRTDHLSKETGLHRATIYRMLQKLIESGYVRRVLIKRRKPNGTIFESVSLYTVYESKRDGKAEEELDHAPF